MTTLAPMAAGAGPAWAWMVAGICLCAAEMFASGVFLLWLGIAAIATGLVCLVVPLGAGAMALTFGVFALASVAVGRGLYGAPRAAATAPLLNRRAQALIGRDVPLLRAIRQGEGAISVDDTVWRVRGNDAGEGTRVRIVAIEDGVLLRVEQAPAQT